MTQIANDEILVFGGEDKSLSCDLADCYRFKICPDDNVLAQKEADLPRACTPLNSSAVLNFSGTYYFVSVEGRVYRRCPAGNWSEWEPIIQDLF